MRMRVAVLGGALVAAAALPVPAFAREANGSQVAEVLANPGTQRAMAGAMAAMTEAMLDMKVGPFAKAMEGMDDATGNRRAARRIDPNATLGDLAGPEARRMPREVARKMPKMMGAMAGARPKNSVTRDISFCASVSSNKSRIIARPTTDRKSVV